MNNKQAYWTIKTRLGTIRDELQTSSALRHNCQRIDEALAALDILRPLPEYCNTNTTNDGYRHEVVEVDLEAAQKIHDAWIEEHT